MSDGGRPARIAILLATYDGAAHLEAQMRSLLWQQGVEIHIFARDDGSRDATPAILADWHAAHSDRITVVTDALGPGGSATSNFFRLLEHSDFEGFDYVALADQDDVWFPDKLDRAVAMLRYSGAAGYSSDLLAYDETRNLSWILAKAGRPAELDYLFQGASAGCTYVLTVAAARRVASKLRESTATLPRGASHDWIIYAICRSYGSEWFRDSSARIMYRQHAANVYGALPGLRGLIAKGRMVRDKWYREHILWLRHVIGNNAEERRILDALRRGGVAGRLFLFRGARKFRRTPRDVRLLRLALMSGAL